MFEVYVLVEKRKPMIMKFFGIFSWVIGVISMIATAIGIYFFLPTAVLGILLGYFFQSRNFEFEYSFFDDEVRFAKIINKSRRKKLPGYKMDEVVIIAPAGDQSVYNYENNGQNKIRRLQSGYPDRKVYVLVAKAPAGFELVYFEPDDKYLDAVCIKNGYKVRR